MTQLQHYWHPDDTHTDQERRAIERRTWADLVVEHLERTVLAPAREAQRLRDFCVPIAHRDAVRASERLTYVVRLGMTGKR